MAIKNGDLVLYESDGSYFDGKLGQVIEVISEKTALVDFSARHKVRVAITRLSIVACDGSLARAGD